MVVMVGDGVKQSKEGRYMPGVKRLHQESENLAKGEYIFGYMFGGVGVLIGNTCQKMYCVLVSLRLLDGLRAIHGWWKNELYIEESHVVKIIKDAGRASKVFGKALLLLDRLSALISSRRRPPTLPTKVFVSVAVRGLNKEQTEVKHEEYRLKIADIIGEYEDISINNADREPFTGITAEKPAVYWLGLGLQKELAKADLAVFCGDISQTRGAR